MTTMREYSPVKKSGCGIMMFYTGVFRRRRALPRRSASTSDIPTPDSDNVHQLTTTTPKRRRGGSDETAFIDTSNLTDPPQKLPDKPVHKATPNHRKTHSYHQQNQTRKPSDGITTSSTSSTDSSQTSSTTTTTTTKVSPTQGRKVPKEAIGISGELDSMIADHQKSKACNTLVRASSGNVMLYGHLGNLRQKGAGNMNSHNLPNSTTNVLEHLPKTARETNLAINGRNNSNSVMGNIVRTEKHHPKEQTGSLCLAPSNKSDPEELKAKGNEEYKKGNFAEALALYDQAIAIDPNKASYRSNKSAALMSMGRLLEAVFECKEAIRIEPSYQRAHHRLATLYLRLGDPEKSLYHYKHSGPEANSNEITQVQALRTQLDKCTEARKLKEWKMLLKETECTLSCGADSAPQVLASKAEALLKLHRHEDADTTLTNGLASDMDAYTKFYGPDDSAYLLLIRAQVDMAAGRFEDAIEAAQKAARLDSGNKEVGLVVRRARAVASARSNGNELFKASKFLEASAAYSEGLEHDPLNSVLLCNRAACRSKLGQFEKAVEDCTRALELRPSYGKARLRRADCNAKLERWEASIQDYEMLIRETPGDEKVGRALFEAQVQLKKRRGEDVKDMKFGADVVVVANNERFRHLVTSPGMSVVLFCNKSSDNQTFNFMQQLCKKYPSVNFLKVSLSLFSFVIFVRWIG
uniref:Inactive TPR repeat-containing thioredoxin TTL3-like n=1 Tax=Nelumbo nucifera TaxID=4432 RepID=A0A822ZBA2_NELNU|nr:TPA_asm: hypothetical protein HUJ06_014639 [Nelumbo nucifera]